MRVFWDNARPMVDWGYLGARRFVEPFFEDTIGRCVRHPADLLFRHQTPLEKLGEIAAAQPGVAPTGFIFHMSRCGSTLLCQMLAASVKNIVISEASPIDTILRAHFRQTNISDEERVQWLRWMVAALGWRRHPAEKHLFIKFDCWHTLSLPLIERAFPGVPWVFLYRDPLEVLASHQNHCGPQMVPGLLDPSLFGWDAPTVRAMTLEEYGARALAKICEAPVTQAQRGMGKLVNYRQLPGEVWPALLQHWGVEFSPEESVEMMKAARLNAKNPALPFEEDSQAKRQGASEATRALARQWLEEIYVKLEGRRMELELR
jgi:hypothetical protein